MSFRIRPFEREEHIAAVGRIPCRALPWNVQAFGIDNRVRPVEIAGRQVERLLGTRRGTRVEQRHGGSAARAALTYPRITRTQRARTLPIASSTR